MNNPLRKLLTEQELYYAVLEGKHCAIDDDRDNGRFYMHMAIERGNDPEYWNIFTNAYRKYKQMNNMENKL